MKNLLKKLVVVFTFLGLVVLTVGCSSKKEADSKEVKPNKEDNKIVIGVSPTPHAEIIEYLQPEFKKAGLDVEVKVFDDYVQPNLALDNGDIDANYFQHIPYLEAFSKDHNLKLASIGGVHVEPIGFYSAKYKNFNDLPDGAEILIPNDPTNGARALILLEKNGLIKLKDPSNLKSTEVDIVENPKHIKFVAVDAPTIPKTYQDVDGGVINSNYAIGADIDPKTALVVEDKTSPYTNIVAVREDKKDAPKFKKFMEVLQSDATKKFIEEKFKGAVVPAFSK